ncbi:hypothetical protein M9H77_11878 [Catharanthus roseus]|uniref:Uncharacterized protein n=1 Tax=Catharanthus roseus TaxID=4058 RepID=A0ACC0BFX0_CATRO|nr:hypothetical protein M9H77_11878 [Catharanthus roseus]
MIALLKITERLIVMDKRIRELNWSKFVLDSIVTGVRKQKFENKASVIGVLSWVTTFRGIVLSRGEDVPIVDVEELGVDVHLEGVHKRLDLLDQNMKELREGLEAVREEVTYIGKSMEATNRSKGWEDELRDIREEEGRRFYFGNSRKWNEEDDELGGDVNDEIGVVANKRAEWKTENEEEKETPNEEYVGFDNEYNDMKMDKDGFSDANDKFSERKIGVEDNNPLNLDVTLMATEEVDILRHWKQLASKQTSLRPSSLNKIRETESADILIRLMSIEHPRE